MKNTKNQVRMEKLSKITAALRTLQRRGIMKKAIVMLLVLSAGTAGAEPYVQLQGGLSIPSSLSSFEGEYASKGAFSVSDLAMQPGLAYGAKAGYFFDAFPALGLEVDYLHATPGNKGQDYEITWHQSPFTTPGVPAGSTYTAHEPRMRMKFDTIATNLVFRYPGETWQPFVAMGPAAFYGNYGGDPTNLAIGLNAEAGLRMVVWKGLFVSASYRYQQAHLTFRESSGPNASINGFNVLYQNQFVLGGLGWNF